MNDLSSLPGLHPPIFQKSRVAILVDGDNFSHRSLAAIEMQAAEMGDTVIRRVYCDISMRKDWAAETDYLAIHCTTLAGKNRADMHLVVGAMDMAHRGLATHFLIVSNDRDFGPLVAHLREIGMQVEWAMKPKPPAAMITTSAIKAKIARISELDQKLHDHLKQTRDGIGLQTIGHMMKNGTVKAQTGKATWRAYFVSKPDLYVLRGERTETIVTLKNP